MAETFLFVQEPMTGFTLDTTYGYLATLANPSFSLVSGKTYLVIWDDLERPYTVTAYDATIPGIGSFVAIGNGTALGYQGNNEPFVIAANSAMAYFLAFADSASSHVVAIAQADGIILRDYKDEPTAYYGREVLEVPSTVEGESVNYVREDLVPEAVEQTVELDFSGGDMVVTPEAGQLFEKVRIPVPANLTPANIAEGVDIAGIAGTLVASGGASNVCMATYTAGYSYEATRSAVTLISKEDLDKIGFDSATKKFAIMIATDSGAGMYGYDIPAIIAQTNYAISSAGSSSNAYGVKLSRYKTSSSASYTSVRSAYCTSDSISIGIDGWMRYNNYGLQYYGGSNNPLFASTYIIIAGVIS